MSFQPWKQKANRNRWDYIKLKRFCKMKDTIKKIKSQLLHERPYLQTIYHISKLVSKTYKELMQFNLNKRKQPS